MSKMGHSRFTIISILIFGFTLFFGLSAIGLPLRIGLNVSISLGLYSAPFFILASQLNWVRLTPLVRISVSFGLGSILLALLFGFTKIADSPILFWILGLTLNVFSFTLFLWRTELRQIDEGSPRHGKSNQSYLTVLIPGLMVILASIAQGRISPLTRNPTTWLPDDYPIFANWAQYVSSGTQGDLVIEGFNLKYHWLTYSFLGGLDRLFSDNFMNGPVLIAPVIAWVGLSFGAVTVVTLMSRNFSAATVVLASTSVLFANTVGVMAYSTGGIGGITVSPSHLISASWLIVSMILFFLVFTNFEAPERLIFLFFILGFAMALAKFTSFVAVFLGAVAMLLVLNHIQHGIKSRAQKMKSFLLPTSFLMGGALAFFKYISGIETEIDIDQSLKLHSDTSFVIYLVQLLPLGAYAFSIMVLILPTIFLAVRRVKKEPLVAAAATLSSLGFFIAVILQLRDSNEAWFISGALAFILPVSSVLVSQKISFISRNFDQGRLIWILTLAIALFLTSILIWSRNMEMFQIRPWLTPSLIIGTPVIAWALYLYLRQRTFKTSAHVTDLIKPIGSLLIATLFLTSILFGIGLRSQSFLHSFNKADNTSLSRNLWLKGAQDLVDTKKFDSNNRAIAVYSTSRGEQTLSRWIPLLTQKRVYSIRSDDLVRHVFLSAEQGLMSKREATIQEYVETNSMASCTALRNDGILQIWVTPNTDFDDKIGASISSHTLIDVKCV